MSAVADRINPYTMGSHKPSLRRTKRPLGSKRYDHGDGWISNNDTELGLLIEHRDGIPWYDAPIPPNRHRCWPQSRGLVQDVERCACGGLRYRHGRGSRRWAFRNQRTPE